VRFHKLVSLIFFVAAYLSLISQILLAESTNPWKHEIVFPDEPFEQRHHSGTTNMGWIKFTIPKEANALEHVTYQDSCTYELHYEFVTAHLDPFTGISPEEFQRVSLYEQDQQLILGAVVTPPNGYPSTPIIQEVGIQFVRSDPYAKEEIVHLFEIVKSTIIADPNVTFYYLGNVIYSRGWAFGRLKHIPSDQIQTAYLKGELLASDILLTDIIPAEIPVVAGIISLSPSTPNSHVAILAATYAIPFVYLTDESTIDQAMTLLEHEIVLRATAQRSWDSQVDLIDTEGILSEEQAGQLLALKQPADLNIQPTASLGLYSLSTEEITLHDIRYVGGKAAHYSLLRNAIRDNSRTAVTFTFDLWNEFLDQKLASGISLREDINGRLSRIRYEPEDQVQKFHQR
jgi:hypothetical protein